jgi:hypothetical protein
MQTLVNHDTSPDSNTGFPWPSLAERILTVGGAAVTYAEALRAAQVLRASRTSAIAPVLRAAGSPLAGCDYFAAAAPFLDAARQAPKTGRAGAAGRHVTKNAFLAALGLAMAVAREQDLAAALEAFASDERYAVAIARDAVALRERAYAAGVRSSVRAAVARAVASCGAAEGRFTCDEQTACGTGACRFAAPACRAVTVPAAPGRFARPANHVRAGEPFTEAGAAAQLAAAGSAGHGVQVWDSDALAAGERAA